MSVLPQFSPQSGKTIVSSMWSLCCVIVYHWCCLSSWESIHFFHAVFLPGVWSFRGVKKKKKSKRPQQTWACVHRPTERGYFWVSPGIWLLLKKPRSYVCYKRFKVLTVTTGSGFCAADDGAVAQGHYVRWRLGILQLLLPAVANTVTSVAAVRRGEVLLCSSYQVYHRCSEILLTRTLTPWTRHK